MRTKIVMEKRIKTTARIILEDSSVIAGSERTTNVSLESKAHDNLKNCEPDDHSPIVSETRETSETRGR